MSTALLRILGPLGLSCMLVATPTLAADQTPQRVISFSDLDLTTRAGQNTLHNRMLRAAGEVCGGMDLRDLDPMHEVFSRCRDAALATAMPQAQLALARAREGKNFASNDTKVASGVTQAAR